MFIWKKSSSILFVVLFILTACTTQSGSTATPATATFTSIPSPTATATALPTPSSPADSILWDDLQVSMDQFEITQEYVTDFGPTRNPPAGKKFLWVHIRLRNTGQTEMDVPVFEHYSILYAALEIKPIYGHRQGYVDYSTLGTIIYPQQELNGWLRFDIPDTAGLGEILFVFIPESAQIGTSYSSPSYPYASDKPTYVWSLAQ